MIRIKQYGLLGWLKLVKNLLLTKIVYPNARLIKFPIDIRNKRNIVIGAGFSTGVCCRVEAYPADRNHIVLNIGKNFKINDRVHIAAHFNVTIGDNVLVASSVFITDLSHGSYQGKCQSLPSEIVDKRPLNYKPVFIGNNVWLGEHVMILPGVKLGDNCIVGAGSVVTRSFDANSIIAGNPAKLIKVFDHLTNKWVKYD